MVVVVQQMVQGEAVDQKKEERVAEDRMLEEEVLLFVQEQHD